MYPHSWTTRLAREEQGLVSEPTTKAPGVSHWNEEPRKYSFDPTAIDPEASERLVLQLEVAEVKINMMTDYSLQLIDAIVPLIVAERRPRTLEFVNTMRLQPDRCKKMIRGAVIRAEQGVVLLYAYGIGLDSNSEEHYTHLMSMLDIPTQEQRRIVNMVWTRLEYSAMVALS